MKIRDLKLVLPCLFFALFTTIQAQGLRFITCSRATNGIVMKWTNSVAGQSYTVQSRDTDQQQYLADA